MTTPRPLSELAPEVQSLLHTYVKRVGGTLGSAVHSIILYGSAARGEYRDGHSNINVLLALAHVDGDVLRKLTPILSKWKKDHVASLVLTSDELQHWTAQFPLEFGDLVEQHVLLAGRDPFIACRPDPKATVEASIREVRANLIRLRQRFIEGGATNESAVILVPLSVTSLGACLRGLLRAWDISVAQRTDAVVRAICERLALDPGPFLEGWALRCGQITPGPLEVPRLFDRYMAGLQGLCDRLAVTAK
ncbi:hypothetical protein YTPLAS18_17580 [Nitrospira sp.]|nr:hypothetical protein YTPLAS18_17580 [Nitrospira sp.]